VRVFLAPVVSQLAVIALPLCRAIFDAADYDSIGSAATAGAGLAQKPSDGPGVLPDPSDGAVSAAFGL